MKTIRKKIVIFTLLALSSIVVDSHSSSGPFTGETKKSSPGSYLNAVFKLLLSESSSSIPTSTSSSTYTLFSSLGSTTAYLMDNDSNFVHSWSTGYRPGNAVYFLENGSLLHTGNLGNTTFDAGGRGGVVSTFNWDGDITWQYEYSSNTHLQHHDVEMLPNGNVLMIVWQYKGENEAVAAGRNPALLTAGELWPDSVIEVQPSGLNSGQIVWQWHVWDHLVQDYDSTKDNYGVVADHPELIDLNFAMNGSADWNHSNSIDYNEELDQVILSVRNFSEIWVIDHSTTTVEAATHSGGNGGKGGDLLYRWGNPQAYGRGIASDQQLFVQHDAEWIEAGYPGAGNILIFNNGDGRPAGNYSSIEEITPPVNSNGSYTLQNGGAYGPDQSSWSYTDVPPTDFYAKNISGQQRLTNGNTLICNGPDAHFFEVDSSGAVVWEYDYTGAVFRIERYADNYAGFDGTPLDDSPANQIPTADAGGPYTTSVGTHITLDGSASIDNDGNLTQFKWDMDNDGQYDDANSVSPSYSASGIGVFTVSLQVTDNGGAVGTDSTTVIPPQVSAAIDPIFNITQITNEDNNVDYPWFWTGTTHIRANGSGSAAVYLCFGRAMGYVGGNWLDVHGAGAQRSDKKGGDFTGYTYAPYGYYFSMSPQGDATRIYNYVRPVRDAD